MSPYPSQGIHPRCTISHEPKTRSLCICEELFYEPKTRSVCIGEKLFYAAYVSRTEISIISFNLRTEKFDSNPIPEPPPKFKIFLWESGPFKLSVSIHLSFQGLRKRGDMVFTQPQGCSLVLYYYNVETKQFQKDRMERVLTGRSMMMFLDHVESIRFL